MSEMKIPGSKRHRFLKMQHKRVINQNFNAYVICTEKRDNRK